jgi:integrase/recombinase XerD
MVILAPIYEKLAAKTARNLAAERARNIARLFLLRYGRETRRAYATDLRDLGKWCAENELDVLTLRRSDLELYVRELADRGLSPATVARRLAAIAGFYAYAIAEDAIARSPLRALRRPPVPRRPQALGLGAGELAIFLAAARRTGSREHALACLLALNGLRVSEACAADAADLGLARGRVVLRIVRKGGNVALVPLAARTASALAWHLRGRRRGPLLACEDGEQLDRFRAWRMVRRIAADAGLLAPVSPHTLRHSFVTIALDAGASLRDVQDAAGHADPKTTRQYDRAREQLDRHPTFLVAASVSSGDSLFAIDEHVTVALPASI